METTLAPSSTPTIPDSARVRPYDTIVNIVGLEILGIAGIVANVFILIIVRKNKNLRNSCFLLICGECVCSIFMSIGGVLVSTREAALLTNMANVTQMRVVCYIYMALFRTIGIQGSNLFTCCVATDRLISILTPIFYRQMGNRYVKVCWAFCLTYATISASVGIFDTPSRLRETVECTKGFSAVSRGYTYMAYNGAFNSIFSGLCVFLYLAMLIAFVWKKKTIVDPTAAQGFLKQQRACMPTVKLLMTFYGITVVFPEIALCILLSSEFTAVYVVRTAYYFGPLKSFSALAQIVGLYFGSEKFRVCVKTLLGMKTGANVVTPMGNVNNQRIGPSNVSDRRMNMITGL